MIEIFLAGTVRGKGRPRFSRATGRAFTDGQTVNYEAALRIAGQEAMNGRAPLEGALGITVTAVFEVPASYSRVRRQRCLEGGERPAKRPDVDNLVKMMDGLNGVVWKDDAQICMARIIKKYGSHPGLTIRVGLLDLA